MSEYNSNVCLCSYYTTNDEINTIFYFITHTELFMGICSFYNNKFFLRLLLITSLIHYTTCFPFSRCVNYYIAYIGETFQRLPLTSCLLVFSPSLLDQRRAASQSLMQIFLQQSFQV